MKEHQERMDLSGAWRFCRDEEDAGLQAKWYQSDLPGDVLIDLPGTTATNGIGEPFDFDGCLNETNVRQLRQRHRYVGVAWYQRSICVPLEWDQGVYRLRLERVMFSSCLFLDNRQIGTCNSLSTAHEYDLTEYLSAGGEHLLTLRIDNRDVQRIGPNPSAYTDETQTIWNGVIGAIQIRRYAPLALVGMEANASWSHRRLNLRLRVRKSFDRSVPAEIHVSLWDAPGTQAMACLVHDCVLGEGAQCEVDLALTIPQEATLQCWEEQQPKLYEIRVEIEAMAGSHTVRTAWGERIGFRDIAAESRQLTVNGHPLFLRGTLDCCVFPLTGYPPMEEEPWRRILSTVKEYGLNHVRYHSWCPPEACFRVADELGLYLQVEGPVWMDNWMNITVGANPEHYVYLPKEARRILDAYGNHPSFCFFSNGNELNGDFRLLSDIIRDLKAKRNNILYTLSTNWDRDPDEMDDVFIAQCVDGIGVRGQYYPEQLAAATDLTYDAAVQQRTIPVIAHEVGQYCVYPNMDEIGKYAGVLRPVNLEAIHRDLEKKGMLAFAKAFIYASGKLAAQLYKDEIEAALRTESFGGFQLLDLHDFPGQSTATVGLLDDFWDSKGLINSEEFREFCAQTVLLADMSKRIYRNSEEFRAGVRIAHYAPQEMAGQKVLWELLTSLGEVVYCGEFQNVRVRRGDLSMVGEIHIPALSAMRKPNHLTLRVALQGTAITNSWPVYVYPMMDETATDHKHDFVLRTIWDDETRNLLEQGQRVLLLPSSGTIAESHPGKFYPVFWSPVHFASKDPCGLLIRDQHPVFRLFPTESYSSYPWKEPLDHTFSMVLDSLPADLPMIVQTIPNFYHNQRMAIMFEAAVGRGKLFVCSVNLLADAGESVVLEQLRRSISGYLSSEDFLPEYHLDMASLNGFFLQT